MKKLSEIQFEKDDKFGISLFNLMVTRKYQATLQKCFLKKRILTLSIF